MPAVSTETCVDRDSAQVARVRSLANDSALTTDWETPAGPDIRTVDRHALGCRPTHVYRGNAEPHWRNQACWAVAEPTSTLDVRYIVLACGCHARVPTSTLDTAAVAAPHE